MKRKSGIRITFLAAAMVVPALASAQSYHETWAPVLEAVPVRQQVRIPVNEEACWDETVYRAAPARRPVAPRILGAIVGGAIGHQFGGGSGQDLMTAAGAALGATVVAEQQYRRNPDRYYETTERRCEVRTNYRYEDRIVAWDVTYQVAGEQYRSRMQRAPGDRIRVQVGVQPLAE